MLRWLRRAEGGVMVLTAVSSTTLILFTGFALDFGRIHLLKAELQTAVDAAALAGAMQAPHMVSLQIGRNQYVPRQCTDPVTGQPYSCGDWVSASPVRVAGSYRDLITRGGWRSHCDKAPFRCTGEPSVIAHWFEQPADPERMDHVARDTFTQNASAWPRDATGTLLKVETTQLTPEKVEMKVEAEMAVPTTFLQMAGVKELRVVRTGTASPSLRN